jgi:hypothetical protein
VITLALALATLAACTNEAGDDAAADAQQSTTEVAEISTTWIDVVLTSDPRLERPLLEPCSSCPPGTWTAEARDHSTLAVR